MPKTLKTLILPFLCLAALSGYGGKERTITVGASSTPHAIILEKAKEYVSSQGYRLEVRVFDDYVLPNYALEGGELDANYFQHKPYLEEFNAANGTHIVPVLDVHFEPMGVYAGRKSSLADFGPSDLLVVPSDKSNRDRASALLASLGMSGARTKEVEAQSIPLMLEDCDYAVINGNYALSSGVVGRCLATESKDSEAAQRMANIIAVRNGSEDSEKTRVLKDALRQEGMAEFVASSFGDSVIYLA